ncbi:FAD_binding_domain_containing_protein [Leishmania braziliensis MHOM/BR/75/M2904]|uniref:FAD_binding_domain_containing_protein n=1 Tax=Leishmania braziliensis MHOM/BR/75/M2904 TaxID=420245 RepID=A0A3P3ZBD5_LEIBR|nr:FAD_binding_domain_containing_protein [Leishmania braziliensis MHOM/BR/75/M2904]
MQPNPTEKVTALVKACLRYEVPMTPRGAGADVEGVCIPYSGGISIATDPLTWMNFELDSSCLWVGAGVGKKTLNRAAAKHGFVFAPGPSSELCVGGMAATFDSGVCTLRYGDARVHHHAAGRRYAGEAGGAQVVCWPGVESAVHW